MNQTDQITRHLKKGKSLTALQALERFNCWRLAARVNEIRATHGEDSVSTQMVERDGKRYARYRWQGQ